ncbi:MAG: YitT family protein [Bacillota bacterium]|nr:YitT family protein [Bacillota bacterium]
MKKKLIVIGVGSIFISLGINTFLLPAHLINGGIFGISLLFKYLWGFKISITIICLNLPIYLLAFKQNPSYFYNSLYGVVVTSIMLDLLLPFSRINHLPILPNALLGGLMIGVGVGIMIRENTCPGGIDLLAFLISKGTSINIGFLLIIFDALIIASGLWILKDSLLIYSFITVGTVACIAGILTSFKSIVFIT